MRSIIERSNLPHEQKHRLLADMSVKETQSNAVSKGLTQYFGEDSESLREALWACMYQCVQESNNESAVSHGSLWQTEQGAVIQLDAIDASHSLTQNTDILIERFAEHFSGQSLRDRFAEPQQAGLAIRQFCRSLYLAIQLEDEEEEEAWSIPDME